jgi:chemotaxis protein methyltransferase CheR
MKNSNSTVPPYRMDQLAAKVEAEMGLSFAGAKQRDLGTAIRRMAESLGLDSDIDCVDWLLADPWEKPKSDLCALHLTIAETYFFREPRALNLVCDYIRDKMNAPGSGNDRIRIWSAGCCTGEEPYSIAMALKQAIPGLDPRRISILGTDINSKNLQAAAAGMYRQWSFRNPHATLHRSYFTEEDGGRFRLAEQIKELVRFSELNLAAPVYPSDLTDTHSIDIIFCRNVLMYFSKREATKVIERFRECLVNGGWLIVSPSEASADMFPGFSGVYFPDAIYFQKTASGDDARLAQRPSSRLQTREPWRTQLRPGASSGYKLPAATGQRQAHAVPAAPDPGPLKNASVQTAPIPIKKGIAGAAAADAAVQARALANEGRTAEAMQCLERAMQLDRSSIELYHAKALVAMESGDHRTAELSLKQVLYLQPDFILAYYLMGVLHAGKNRRREALRQFEIAKELLAQLDDDALVPGSEGMTAAYLLESVQFFLQKGCA